MRSRWRRRRAPAEQEMNITAFMNLMVVLIPFLLITAVFSRMSILELSLPSGEPAAAEEPVFQLEVIVRADAIEIGERSRGLMTRLPAGDAGHDLAALADFLKRVKAEHPDMSNATVLLEPDVPYDLLVQVMDAVRLHEVVEEGRVVRAELFPDIAVGDAPVG